MKRNHLYFIAFVFVYCFTAGAANAQVTNALTDTARYMPGEHNFRRDDGGWEIINRKKNVATRSIASQSVTGYRYVVNRGSTPRTGLTFQVVVTLLRAGPSGGDPVNLARAAYQNMFRACQQGYYRGSEEADYGDESFTAVQNPTRFKVFVRRGGYLIDVTGSDDAPGHRTKPELEATARFLADFIDSRIFGARIGVVRPIQVLNDFKVPLVAGKKTVVYLTVETEKGVEFPADYLLTLNVGKRGFKKEEYSIPLGSLQPVEFDPVGNDTDGTTWPNEYAESVRIGLKERSAFRLKEEKRYRTDLYRFFLDPVDPKFFGDYNFRVTIIDPKSSSRLRETVVKASTRPSKVLKVAVMPLPVGYWSPPDKWDVENWAWISNLEDRGWERQSFVRFAAPLPENTQRTFSMHPKIREYLKKTLFKSKGKTRYLKGTKEGSYFLKGVMPVAEENFEIYLYDRFPEDLDMEPFPKDVASIQKALEKWNRKHPRFHRVIGITPGCLPRTSGVEFYLDENTGATCWFKGKYLVLPVETKPFEYAREMARTFGAVSGWMTPQDAKKMGPGVINTPTGMDGGQLVTRGYWPGMRQFRGLPVKPENSIMGKLEPAWITGELFRAISERLPLY